VFNADIAGRGTVGPRFGRLTMVMGFVLVADGGLNRRFLMAERTKVYSYGDRRQRAQGYERKHEDKDYDVGRARHANAFESFSSSRYPAGAKELIQYDSAFMAASHECLGAGLRRERRALLTAIK
jgi:hypothetical protein